MFYLREKSTHTYSMTDDPQNTELSKYIDLFTKLCYRKYLRAISQRKMMPK
jgi:hypothetical protein